jgi:hypothetical protein
MDGAGANPKFYPTVVDWFYTDHLHNSLEETEGSASDEGECICQLSDVIHMPVEIRSAILIRLDWIA